MKKQSNGYFVIIFSLISGISIPVMLFVAIPVLFNDERIVKLEKPIIIEMVSMPQPVQAKQKPIKSPDIAKKTPTKRQLKKQVVKKKIVKKRIIKTVNQRKMVPTTKPIIKKAEPVEKVVEKIIERKIEETKPTEMLANQIPVKKISPTSTKKHLPTPVPIFRITAAPQFLHREELKYPEGMRASGISGIVKLAVLIDKHGIVHRVKIIKSAGELFDKAARNALLASTFIPAKIGNKKVAVELRMPVKFRLL